MVSRHFPLILAVTGTLFLSTSVFAGPKCNGDQPKLRPDKVKQMYQEKGYEIKKFKVSSGGCYEIYGIQAGKKVEVYIDPWTASELQKETK